MFENTADLLKQIALGEDSVLELKTDEQMVPNATADHLNPKLWNRFRTVISPKDGQEFLEKMKLIAKDEDGVFRPTVSGVLMACDSPETFMANAFVQAVCYRGSERNAAYQLDAKDITGPLDMQIKDACKFVEGNCGFMP